jgi:REP element-mobilizing transposase RayT
MANILYKNKYRIPSTRYKEWDYSEEGFYFVTICTDDRKMFFGDVVGGEMVLSPIGKIVKDFWLKIPEYFNNTELDEFVVMPNHLHGIIVICNTHGDCCIRHRHCRDAINRHYRIRRDAINRVSTIRNGGVTKHHNPMGKNTLGEIIRWYKGRSTFEIRKIYKYFAWQERFYDHIIRNEKELNRIREYIIDNPGKWVEDRNNPNNLGIQNKNCKLHNNKNII